MYRDDGMMKSLKELDNAPDMHRKGKSKPVGGTVCRYWLENRCKKAENCEYLHERDEAKLPECPYSQNQMPNNFNIVNVSCNRINCPFKHTPRQIKECVNYANGLCKEGILYLCFFLIFLFKLLN